MREGGSEMMQNCERNLCVSEQEAGTGAPEDSSDSDWPSAGLVATSKMATLHIQNVCIDIYAAKICEGCAVNHPSQLQQFCLTVRTHGDCYPSLFQEISNLAKTQSFVSAVQFILQGENFLMDNYTAKVMITTILFYFKSERTVYEPIFSSYKHLSPRLLS